MQLLSFANVCLLLALLSAFLLAAPASAEKISHDPHLDHICIRTPNLSEADKTETFPCSFYQRGCCNINGNAKNQQCCFPWKTFLVSLTFLIVVCTIFVLFVVFNPPQARQLIRVALIAPPPAATN